MEHSKDKTAYYGYILMERFGDKRVRHFRKSTARRLSVAEARIHDLIRNGRWSEERIFEIWDGINPKLIITCKKNENGNIVISKKDYFKEYVGFIETRKGKIFVNDVVGRDRDYYLATKYRRNVTIGAKRGDLTQFVKKEAMDRVLCQKVDARNYKVSEKVTKREF